MSSRFTTRWVSLREADRFIAQHHRHHNPAQGGIVALGLWEDGELVGVGVIGRPVNRVLQSEGVAELTRLCVCDDVQHAASALLGALRRLAQTLGFRRLVTYTLPSEGGTSLRAAGWQADLMLVGGREWSCAALPRAPATWPVVRKQRWWAPLKAQAELRV